MAQPVWVLSVDLQTRTATFTSGLADAAKGARTSFQDIKAGAQEMGRETGYSMMEARHSVMMMGEEVGVRLPRALSTFIAGLGPIGPALQAAFPFLAIAVGAKILLDHLGKMKEEASKNAEVWKKVGDVGAEAFDVMRTRLVEAEIRADELAGDHLGALEKKLHEIDHSTMREVIGELDKMAAAADTAFKGLEHGWFMQLLMGHADVGPAKQQLEDFISEIDKLKTSNAKPEAVNSLINVDVEKVTADMNSVWNRLQSFRQQDAARRKAGDAFASEANDSRIKQAQEEWSFKQKELDLLNQMAKVSGEGVKVASVEKSNEQGKDPINLIGRGDAVAAMHHKMAEAEEKSAEESMKIQADVTRYFHEQYLEREKLAAEGGKQEAEHVQKMGELAIAAEREQGQLRLSAMLNSARARTAMDFHLADEEYKVKLTANSREIDALDKDGKDYQNKLRALQNKELELTKEHENKLTQIKISAEEQRNERILTAQRRLADAEARGLTEVLTRQESFSKMMDNLGRQVAEGMIENALKAILADDMTKPHDAAAAARKAYLAGMHFPFPVNLVMAPTLGAAAFATVMAFDEGGVVGGTSGRDTVSARLTPGEGVIPKRLMEGLTNAAKHGNGDDGRDVHIHHHATYHIQAMDSTGVQGLLEKHGDAFARHAANHIRKMNH